jgi:hypothetical protein
MLYISFNVLKCIGKVEKQTNIVMHLDKSTLDDLKVVKNNKKQQKRKSPSKKIAIEVQLVFIGHL